MFPKNKKVELLLTCLYAGWSTHPRTSRTREFVALDKGGVVVEFHDYAAKFYWPRKEPGQRRRLKLELRLPYRKVCFDLADLYLLVNIPPHRKSLNLMEPLTGLLEPEPPPPDLPYLRQFVEPIQRLTERLGRAPAQIEIIRDVYYGTDRGLSEHRIAAALVQGEGILWKSVRKKEKHQRRRYYLLPKAG